MRLEQLELDNYQGNPKPSWFPSSQELWGLCQLPLPRRQRSPQRRCSNLSVRQNHLEGGWTYRLRGSTSTVTEVAGLRVAE